MPSRHERKAAFLKAHPNCCYCGGAVLATEEDHNPPRAMFPKGSVPADFRFPACVRCNRSKKDAESRAALVSSAFSRVDPHNEDELQRSVKRGLAFVARDQQFLETIVGHPTHTWDFARGGEPGAKYDPLSFLDVPHVLPEKFGQDMFELGRYFGQAIYYKITDRILTKGESVGVTFFTNCIAEEAKSAISAIVDNLIWTVPVPANRTLDPLFAVGTRYFEDTKTLFFAGSRRGSFMWIGIAGKGDERLMQVEDYHWWQGDGVRLTKGSVW